jgi:enoyl-CoA hydratase/carnithine racemase
MTETILLDIQGPIARITLNNPARHNALGEVQLSALQHCAEAVDENKELRALIITGSGDKTFCAGAALDQLGKGQISGDLFQQATDRLAAVRVPTICALNGNVFGGGVELALSCDFRVGVEGSRLRVPAAQIGLCYPLSGINRFVERLGVNLSKRILIAAEEFNAEDMLRIGFLDYLVPPTALDFHARDLAERIAGLAPLAVQAMKAILQQAAAGSVDVEAAANLSRRCMESEDLKEGFAAQRERRTPVFTGK